MFENTIFTVLMFLLFMAICGIILQRICSCVERCVMLKAFGKFVDKGTMKNAEQGLNDALKMLYKQRERKEEER